MACFIVPTSAAIVTTVFRKKLPKQWHINWLNIMTWGGAVGLTVEHITHQEIVPWPPFLTAMSNPANTVMMLKEMVTVGIPMTLVLALAWLLMVIIYETFIVTKRLSVTARNMVK